MGLAVVEGTIVGRLVGGNTNDLTPADVRALLNITDGADVTADQLAAIVSAATFGFVSNDTTMAADSAALLPTQHAVKAYALAVATSGGIAASIGTTAGDILLYNGSAWTRLGKGNPEEILMQKAGLVVWRLPGLSAITIHNQTSTSFTITSFFSLHVAFGWQNNASPIAMTVPSDTTEPGWEIGQTYNFAQGGVGQVTCVPDTGVTINTAASLKTRAQYSPCALLKTAANTFLLTGDLEPLGQTINPQVGTTYGIVAGDMNRLITGTNASLQTYTFPTNASVPWPIGVSFDVMQLGAGQVLIAGAGGVTVRAFAGAKTAGQYAEINVKKIATDTIRIVGQAST